MTVLSAASRPVYRHDQLARLIAPKSIAIVGASPRAGAFGERTLANLDGYTGRTYLVNARYQEINGRPCFPSVAALPEAPDCVVVTVSRDAVEEVIRDCGSSGAGGAVIYASGYAEVGLEERVREQQRLTELAHQYDLRIAGPNCVGLINFDLSIGLTFSGGIDFRKPTRHAIGIASQSGAVGNAVVQGGRIGYSVSHLLTAGNSCDLDVADFVSYLAGDDSCRAIVCIFEGMARPERLLEAGEMARRAGKPLIVHKIATGVIGAQVAISHTGSIAGAIEIYRALFDRMGAIVVDEFEAIAETAAFFAKAPRPTAFGAGVVSISGGFCVIHADKAEENGVALPPPDAQTHAMLARHLPEFALPTNPCDVTGAAVNNPDIMDNCCAAFLASPAYDTVVLSHSYAWDVLAPRITGLGPLAAPYGKLACSTWTSGWLEGPGAYEATAHPNVALFRSADRCFATLALWYARERQLRSSDQAPSGSMPNRVSDAAQASAAELLSRAEPGVLDSRAAHALLAAYGVPSLATEIARDGDQAAGIATRLGFPVAIKIESAAIAHKTEAGGVLLNINDAAAARSAFYTVIENAAAYAPSAPIDGVSVQSMMPAGLELMVGAHFDPLFGPVVVLALGGTFVEVFDDRVLDFAPLDLNQAARMIDKLKHQSLLNGFRGQRPVNRDALANVISRISQLIADHPAEIAELEINPLICADGEPVGVDALVVVAGSRVIQSNVDVLVQAAL